MNRFSALKRVGKSATAAGTVTWITGKISAESTFEPENIPSESTDGILYGGSQLNGEIMFFDHADYATLVADMTANTEYFWHFEYKDGTTLVTSQPFNIMVRRGGGINARDGLVAFAMSFETYNNEPLV